MKQHELTPWIVRYGYERGVFPMTMDDGDIGWFEPIDRCLFPMEGIRVSRSLARTLRSHRFEVRFDTAFEEVMRGCLRPDDNWISEQFIRVYTLIHQQGWGHCAETWQDGKLVGGVYGVAMGGCFCAESMFYRETDASKVALHALIHRCRELGFVMFDAQLENPHLMSLGAYLIPQEEYMERFIPALRIETPWSQTPWKGRVSR